LFQIFKKYSNRKRKIFIIHFKNNFVSSRFVFIFHFVSNEIFFSVGKPTDNFPTILPRSNRFMGISGLKSLRRVCGLEWVVPLVSSFVFRFYVFPSFRTYLMHSAAPLKIFFARICKLYKVNIGKGT